MPTRHIRRALFEDIMARSPTLSSTTLLPGIVQHSHAARSGYIKADAIALLLGFLRTSKVWLLLVVIDSLSKAFSELSKAFWTAHQLRGCITAHGPWLTHMCLHGSTQA